MSLLAEGCEGPPRLGRGAPHIGEYDRKTREHIEQLMEVADPGERVTVLQVRADGRILIDLGRPSPERVRKVYAAYLTMLEMAAAEAQP